MAKNEQGGEKTNMHKRIAMGEAVTGKKCGGKVVADKKGGRVGKKK